MTPAAGQAKAQERGKVVAGAPMIVVRRMECPSCRLTGTGDCWPEMAPVDVGDAAIRAKPMDSVKAALSHEPAVARHSSRTGLMLSFVLTGIAALSFFSLYSDGRSRAGKLEQQVQQNASEASRLREQVTGLQGDVASLKANFKTVVTDPVELTSIELSPAGETGPTAVLLGNHIDFPAESLGRLQIKLTLRNRWFRVDRTDVQLTFVCTINLQACPVPETRTLQIRPDQAEIEQFFVFGPDAKGAWAQGQYQLEVRVNGSVGADPLYFGVR